MSRDVCHYIVRNTTEHDVELPEYGVTLHPGDEYDLYEIHGVSEDAAYRACHTMTSTSIYQGLHGATPILELRVEPMADDRMPS